MRSNSQLGIVLISLAYGPDCKILIRLVQIRKRTYCGWHRSPFSDPALCKFETVVSNTRDALIHCFLLLMKNTKWSAVSGACLISLESPVNGNALHGCNSQSNWIIKSGFNEHSKATPGVTLRRAGKESRGKPDHQVLGSLHEWFWGATRSLTLLSQGRSLKRADAGEGLPLGTLGVGLEWEEWDRRMECGSKLDYSCVIL